MKGRLGGSTGTFIATSDSVGAFWCKVKNARLQTAAASRKAALKINAKEKKKGKIVVVPPKEKK